MCNTVENGNIQPEGCQAIYEYCHGHMGDVQTCVSRSSPVWQECDPYGDMGGMDECDGKFPAVWRLGTWWLATSLMNHSIKFLGGPAHALSDAGQPSHAAGTLGNYHSQLESTVAKLWEDEGFGKSQLCPEGSCKSKCFKNLAIHYLEDATDWEEDLGSLLDRDWTGTEYEQFYSLFETPTVRLYKALVDDYTLDGWYLYNSLVPLLDSAVGSYVSDCCADPWRVEYKFYCNNPSCPCVETNDLGCVIYDPMRQLQDYSPPYGKTMRRCKGLHAYR